MDPVSASGIPASNVAAQIGIDLERATAQLSADITGILMASIGIGVNVDQFA